MNANATRAALPALTALALLAGCSSAESYRSRTSTETARTTEVARADRQAAEAGLPGGLGARAKPYAYSAEDGGVFLGVDASQAHLRLESRDRYVPVAVLLANRSRKDLALRDGSWSYRAGESGEWKALPSYPEVREGARFGDILYRQLEENDPYSLRFTALNQIQYRPFPDPSGSSIRVDSAALSTMSYAHFLVWIPNPGMTGAGGGHYLRYTDSERAVEIATGFVLIEPKRR